MSKVKIIEVRNPAVLKVLFSLAKENGIGICSNYEMGGSERWPYFAFKMESGWISGKSGEQIVNSTLEEVINLMTKFKENHLKLNNDYTAVINWKNKVVHVGCQKIPFEKVLQLAKLIKK